MSRGIDYGLGRANIDLDTGIRYGVIHSNAVDFWDDYAEPDYGGPHCPECGAEAKEIEDVDDPRLSGYQIYHDIGSWDFACDACELIYAGDYAYPEQCLGYVVDEEDVKAQAGEDGVVFVFLSPYFTRAAFCSPCVPGACYLTQPCEDGERAYCLGHEFFEGKAPYPVYSVETGEEVLPSD